jgi:hypothetical protein
VIIHHVDESFVHCGDGYLSPESVVDSLSLSPPFITVLQRQSFTLAKTKANVTKSKAATKAVREHEARNRNSHLPSQSLYTNKELHPKQPEFQTKQMKTGSTKKNSGKHMLKRYLS